MESGSTAGLVGESPTRPAGFYSTRLAIYLAVSLTSVYNVAKGSIWVGGGRGHRTSSKAASATAVPATPLQNSCYQPPFPRHDVVPGIQHPPSDVMGNLPPAGGSGRSLNQNMFFIRSILFGLLVLDGLDHVRYTTLRGANILL